MKIYYKIILVAILIYFCISIIKENFQQDFTLPKVKIHIIEAEQKKKNFNPEKTLESGQGRHDRIRFEGKWQ